MFCVCRLVTQRIHVGGEVPKLFCGEVVKAEGRIDEVLLG